MDIATDAFTGEIRLFTGSFTPSAWLPCDGRELKKEQYPDLCAVIKDIYGGPSENTFFLPDLRGMTIIGAGGGGILTSRDLGDQLGTVVEFLTLEQMPKHSHEIKVKNKVNPEELTNDPSENVWAKASANIYASFSDTAMDWQAMSSFIGGKTPHTNIQPCIGICYMICWNGIFPNP